jgi:hypothetical protein
MSPLDMTAHAHTAMPLVGVCTASPPSVSSAEVHEPSRPHEARGKQCSEAGEPREPSPHVARGERCGGESGVVRACDDRGELGEPCTCAAPLLSVGGTETRGEMGGEASVPLIGVCAARGETSGKAGVPLLGMCAAPPQSVSGAEAHGETSDQTGASRDVRLSARKARCSVSPPLDARLVPDELAGLPLLPL